MCMLSVCLAKCVIFSGEISLLYNYTVIRYTRGRTSNIPLNLFGKNKKIKNFGIWSKFRSWVRDLSLCGEPGPVLGD
jgi:hypothetical protein